MLLKPRPGLDATERWTLLRLWRVATRTRERRILLFAAFGAVERDPHGEIGGKILEAMDRPGWHKKK